MGVAIEEVNATVAEPDRGAPASGGGGAPQSGFDPEKVRALIRRDEHRRLRLMVD